MAECKSKCEVSSVNVTVAVLTKELNDVSDQWYELGTHMGVKRFVLNSIQAETGSVHYKMIQMLHKWHDSNPSCSRTDVIEALRHIGQDKMAEKLLASKGPAPELEANGMFYKFLQIKNYSASSAFCSFSEARKGRRPSKLRRKNGNA